MSVVTARVLSLLTVYLYTVRDACVRAVARSLEDVHAWREPAAATTAPERIYGEER